MLRVAMLLPLVAAMAGCVTTTAAVRQIDETERTKLHAENKSVVLLHTSLHDAFCSGGISLRLAHPDASGRYVQIAPINLDGTSGPKVPSQVALPAGDYGIVGLTCIASSGSRFNAKVERPGSPFTGTGAVYARPIATFKVGVGEVVDIGSLRLSVRPTGGPFSPRGFVAVVAPMPEERLSNLAAANPKLMQERKTRLMEGAQRI
jgi:hypothetical protein